MTIAMEQTGSVSDRDGFPISCCRWTSHVADLLNTSEIGTLIVELAALRSF
jgi:hypothetical protein